MKLYPLDAEFLSQPRLDIEICIFDLGEDKTLGTDGHVMGHRSDQTARDIVNAQLGWHGLSFATPSHGQSHIQLCNGGDR